VEVMWRCVGRSARYGLDFLNSSGVLRWPAGDSAAKYITIYITRAVARVRAVEMVVEIVHSRATRNVVLIPRSKGQTVIRLVRCTGELRTATFNGRVNPHRGAMGGAGACAPDLVAVKCGDGSRDLWEECDDGGRISGDGCSSACSVEAYWWCFGGTLTRADR
jgi:cysteine-rich repeat protein